ncbi:MAG TPA: hypothetical protein VET87_14095, partial [Rubrivivax sp.]|nr:hypothetical protein [Rubrivivax sp.]
AQSSRIQAAFTAEEQRTQRSAEKYRKRFESIAFPLRQLCVLRYSAVNEFRVSRAAALRRNRSLARKSLVDR